jgi:hypothetical protein
MNEYDVSFWLFLCWEPLIVNIEQRCIGPSGLTLVVKNGIFSGPMMYSSTAVTSSVLPDGYGGYDILVALYRGSGSKGREKESMETALAVYILNSAIRDLLYPE